MSVPVKTLCIKVYPPKGNKSRPIFRNHRAGNGKMYTAKGIDRLLDKYADAIEKQGFGCEYRLVRISDRQYNFVPVEPVAISPVQELSAEVAMIATVIAEDMVAENA